MAGTAAVTIKAEAKKLEHALGGDLADRVAELRPAQKRHIAAFVLKHSFITAAQALYINPDELERCMRDTGHAQCEVCEAWFANESLESSMCGTCVEEMS